MDLFKVVYYPNSECSQLVLAKSILVFDEIMFFDHPSLTLPSYGTVGHPSAMRHPAYHLQQEGYNIRVFEPQDGPIEGELQKIIDADLSNKDYRDTFFQLIRNDPTFLLDLAGSARDQDFGKYGSADAYKTELLKIRQSDIPLTVNELASFRPTEAPFPPEITIALKMAMDSHQLNFAAYTATQENLHLFGDSKGMSMLLDSKFKPLETDKSAVSGVAHKAAFTLLEHIVPNEAFQGKTLVDIVRFRNEMTKERERFKERVLELTVEMQDVSGRDQQKKLDEVVFAHLLPEVRDYQERLAKKWDTFFKESTKAVISDAHHTAELVAKMLPVSLPGALLAGALEVSTKVLPPLVDYLKGKESLNRNNPYAYLMRFR